MEEGIPWFRRSGNEEWACVGRALDERVMGPPQSSLVIRKPTIFIVSKPAMLYVAVSHRESQRMLPPTGSSQVNNNFHCDEPAMLCEDCRGCELLCDVS